MPRKVVGEPMAYDRGAEGTILPLDVALRRGASSPNVAPNGFNDALCARQTTYIVAKPSCYVGGDIGQR